MDLELRPMGKPSACDSEDCVSKSKCVLSAAKEDGVEKDFTPRCTPLLQGEIVVVCHDYDKAE